ncbi:hypothetical protein EYF80_036673 [Liparis tanakae]|uniref:Uncharacterized protein n=1 Tax=Liparis tanakae TaxID=230148 RepID=A0A4Z2GIS0_9TELE|nr:hypothetical protein EYF80_036673 [Liparis tanakae]
MPVDRGGGGTGEPGEETPTCSRRPVQPGVPSEELLKYSAWREFRVLSCEMSSDFWRLPPTTEEEKVCVPVTTRFSLMKTLRLITTD